MTSCSLFRFSSPNPPVWGSTYSETKATSLPLNRMVVAVQWVPRNPGVPVSWSMAIAPEDARNPRLVSIHVPPEVPPRPVTVAGQ
eukprot:3017664-Heterocapsa_arctica.AAC.1